MLSLRVQGLTLAAGAMLAICLCGCAHPRPATPSRGAGSSVDRLGAVEVDGVERTYWLHLPASYDSANAVPLVVVLHEEGGTAKRMAGITGFSRVADEEGFIVVYPEAFERQWDTLNIVRDTARIDDVRFVAKLIDQLRLLLNINSRQVYLVGMSTGGMLAHRIACEHSGKVAGIACVAAPLPGGAASSGVPTQPVSVLLIHGTADEVVPRVGGMMRGRRDLQVLSMAETVDFWLTADGCSDRTAVPIGATAEDSSPTSVRGERYEGYQDTAVVLYTVEGGGHEWPGGLVPGPFRRLSAPSRHDFDATRVIWEFFKAHPRS